MPWFFTHSHTDHVMGFDDLRRFAWERGSMPVYASPETMKDLERVFEFAFKATNPFPGYLKPGHVSHADGPSRIEGQTAITPLPVPGIRHCSVRIPSSRVNGEKLVAYLSDCSGVPPAIVEQIKGVRALIIDALRHKPHPTHLSVDQAIEVARQVQPQDTYFTHIAARDAPNR